MQEGNGRLSEVNEMGERLSLAIDCPVTWPGYSKNGFTCRHGVFFPFFRLRQGWDWVKAYHDEQKGE